MRAPISIVIPTLNAVDELPGTLAALGEGLEAGILRELVLSDGGSEDDIETLATEAGADLVRGPAGRGGQLARGAAAAKGAWLLFLHADTRLSEGWSRAAQAHMRENPRMAGYFRLRFRTEGIAPRLAAGWANLRSRRFGLPYGDQGLLIPRPLYDSVGGYRDIPLMEDVEMARALSGRLALLPAEALTSAARYENGGWIRHGAGNLARLARHRLGADPETLAAEYRRR